jgi:putative restriction endonuclease
MQGTIAITDPGWYGALRAQAGLEEVNFWKPSAARAFRGGEFAPFIFKLPAPQNAVCGFAFFARYSALPEWLAWDSFGTANGVASFAELRQRIQGIRARIKYRGNAATDPIGCILLVQPVFFAREEFIAAPNDWPPRTQSYIHYDLAIGEGARIWSECLERAGAQKTGAPNTHGLPAVVGPQGPRYGAPRTITPRMGQGTFRVAVTDAYGRACALSGEHSLPALEAAHIRAYKDDGPHLVSNGILMRADLHRLFDKGYVTLSPDLRVEVSARLMADFDNGRSYYPLHGRPVTLPTQGDDRPARQFLTWHREHCFKVG